jgi:L-ascorbate metabolism protein UlaG (beta-lactamase superfamily)
MGSDRLAVTWWGHASTTVEIGGVRIVTDPLLDDRLFHLRRYAETPAAAATEADLVLVSHLHHDHCHLPSLRRFDPDVPVLLPHGGEGLLGDRPHVVPVRPGDEVEVAGVRIAVLPAHHDGRRLPRSRFRGPALGFRVEAGERSLWYPGDTGSRVDLTAVAPVDLALVPVGGWGHSLGDEHLDPGEAAGLVDRVGARWAVPVHWGTFFPRGLAVVARRTHRRMFVTPGERFAAAMARRGDEGAEAVVLAHGERVVLDAGDRRSPGSGEHPGRPASP